jgi:hypothetical protein
MVVVAGVLGIICEVVVAVTVTCPSGSDTVIPKVLIASKAAYAATPSAGIYITSRFG